MSEKLEALRGMTRWQYTRRQIVKNKQLYFMVAPFMLFFFMFTVQPVCIAKYLTFNDYNVLQSAKFVWNHN